MSFLNSVCVAFCVLFGIALRAQPDARGTVIDGIVAVVGNQAVLKSELESERIAMRQQGLPANLPDMDCALLEELLFQKLLIFKAALDSVDVPESEIQATIDQRLAYFIQQLGSIEAFEQYYGKSTAEFKDDFHEPIKEQLQSQKMMREISSNVRVTPKEVDDYFKSIPADSLPLIGAQVQYAQIVLDPIITPARKNETKLFLDSIRSQIIAGKTTMFAQAARHSEDPGSKLKGGCYPLQKRGVFAAEYEAAVFSTEEGNYSPIFETQFGYHFLLVKEKRGEYYEACHILRRPLITEDMLDEAKTKLEEISTLILTDSLTFKEAARKYSTDQITANNDGAVLNTASGTTRHDVDALGGQDFFIVDNLEPGDLSTPTPFEKPDGSKSYRVLKLLSRSEAHKASLSTDYELMKSACMEKKQKETMQKWVKDQLRHVHVSLSPAFVQCPMQHKWTGQ